MKNLVFLPLALFLPVAALATSLLPAGHSTCLNAGSGTMMTTCEEGMEFYSDQDGRCGCLAPTEVLEPNICDRAYIRCDENSGETFSSLYQSHNMCGLSLPVFVGCGCFFTDDSMHATSIGD